MNQNRYRRVFSKRLGMLVAVAENVVSQGKAPGEGSASSAASSGQGAFGVVSAMTAFAAAILATQPGVSFAQALPTGGQVTAGQASISQNTNTMTINQGSQRAVIDWNSFNVGAGNTVQFNQPNAQAQALNRVTGAGASNIQGSLLANGQVLIQNANGVLFGKGAVVNVGSTNGSGVIDDNGTYNTDGNGTVNVIDNGDIIHTGGGGNRPDNGGNGTDNNGNGNGTDNGGDSNGTDNGGNTDGQGGGSHGGSSAGGTAAAVVGGLGVAGGLSYLIYENAMHMYLDQAQPLTLELGDATFWADATVEQVSIDLAADTADVDLLTHSGALSRHLAYRDGADGVKHYTFEDEKKETKADLSVNMQTREFFYTESGMKDGKPYVVKSHGWLKPGMAVPHAATVADAGGRA
ncbi:filamentous hemagglutinin N-terminal domain-containing protein [Caballeronia sp. Lep1P3]|uniref:two-partner secretion domain-containing protein n=1 Tax=Caballeronia sp. Lep1P3 TaxID=2878150 RepID=UPI001FD3DD14|nr:filamentous hemagglutinin N-terminal domain-containing protein [Caballeronia sp. Lep1P3]